MRFKYDHGAGSTSQWLSVFFGSGRGYMRQWWCNLNAGPGKAVSPDNDCGHRGFQHCNSAYCSRRWCKAPLIPLLRNMFQGSTLRIWMGPSYNRSQIKNWLNEFRILRSKRPRDLWSPISFG